MKSFLRSPVILLLVIAVGLPAAVGIGVAGAVKELVSRTAEGPVGSEADADAESPAAERPRANQRHASAPHRATRSTSLGVRPAGREPDRRDAPPSRFLPASPGVLTLLCQFRC